jgi:hypothetical protein
MAKGAIKHGTARELADQGVGYSASGSSEHSRHAAHSQSSREHYDFRPERKGKMTHGEFIARTSRQVAKLSGDILLEDNRARKARLQKDHLLKSQLLERLKREALLQ